MSSMNLDTPFAETRAPAPIANEEVVNGFAEYYVNYMALEYLLHGDEYVDAYSSGGSFTSCQSQNIASASDDLEGRGSPQFIFRLREELTKLNTVIASSINQMWVKIRNIAQKLPTLQNAPHLHDCQTIIQQGAARCDELSAEFGDIYQFLNQNIKMCGDLLQASDGGGYNSECDYYQIIWNLVCKNLHFDAVLCGITQIYNHIGNLQNMSVQGGVEGGDGEGAMQLDQIQRVTHKFWLHPKDIMALKLAIAPHLPILQLDEQQLHLNFGAEQAGAQNNPVDISQAAPGMRASTQISSVYLDCNRLQSYHMRLAKEDTSAVHRIRWYGKRDPNSPIQRLYIERKMHRNDWTGVINIKDRAPILQTNIFHFLAGKNNRNVPEMMRRDASADLLLEVQDVIIEKSQKPVMRSVFDRTAFQKIGDSSIRVTIDSNIRMVKENTKKSWCRNLDVESLSSEEVTKFEFCVMEVKLQQEAPEWLLKIIEKSGAVPEIVPAPGFSKFLHGVSKLYPGQVEEHPYWIQKQTDKLNTLDLDQMARRSSYLTDAENPKKFELEETQDKHIVDLIPVTDKVENFSPFQIEKNSQASSSSSNFDQNWQISKNFSQVDSCKLPDARFSWQGQGQQQQQQQVQPLNSKVLIRTRVEPKVFFANERTFLSWLTVAILLVFAALSLMNQQVITIGMPETEGDEGGMLNRCKNSGRTEIQCEAGLISGALMAPVGIILVGYALYMYRKRTFQILRRNTQRYDDQLGPIVLSFMLICVMMLSYALSIIAAL